MPPTAIRARMHTASPVLIATAVGQQLVTAQHTCHSCAHIDTHTHTCTRTHTMQLALVTPHNTALITHTHTHRVVCEHANLKTLLRHDSLYATYAINTYKSALKRDPTHIAKYRQSVGVVSGKTTNSGASNRLVHVDVAAQAPKTRAAKRPCPSSPTQHRPAQLAMTYPHPHPFFFFPLAAVRVLLGASSLILPSLAGAWNLVAVGALCRGVELSGWVNDG
jgi:hypothetical protein